MQISEDHDQQEKLNPMIQTSISFLNNIGLLNVNNMPILYSINNIITYILHKGNGYGKKT